MTTRTTLPHEQLSARLTNITFAGRIPESHRVAAGQDTSRVPKSDQLMDALRNEIELYTGIDRDTGYRIALAKKIDGGNTTRIDGRTFRNYLSGLFFSRFGSTLPSSAREIVIRTLEGLALSGEERIPAAKEGQ